MLYSLDDITLIPAKLSSVKSRSNCSPTYSNRYPLFVAPMPQILNESNADKFNTVNCILPRNLALEDRLSNCWLHTVAISLDEAEEIHRKHIRGRFLIDVANGNMEHLIELADKMVYEDYSNLMIGNIANPETYRLICQNTKIQAVRCSVGTGSCCVTSSYTGFHYPMGSLIIECNKIKNEMVFRGFHHANIIADGGFNTISDIIKALALGADYVMLGKLFAQCKEACGVTYNKDGVEYRSYYGAASIDGQKDFGRTNDFRLPEGIRKDVEVKYYLMDFLREFEGYLRSAMSYAGAKNLEEFIGNVQYDIMSQTAQNKINKV